MKTIIAFLFAIVGIANAAISTATKPHTIDSAVTPKVSYVDDNDEALLDKINEVIDTANIYLGSGVSASVLSTTGDQRLTIDSDNNGTNRWFVTSGGTSDTLLRIIEGGTWKVWGDGTGTKLTLSDSILAATARISGLTASRLMATNADNTLASVSDLTSWVAGTTNQITSTSDGDGSITLSIPNGFTLPSASPTFTGLTLSGNATVGGTLGVTGAVTLSTLSSGRIPVVSTAGLITQDDLYWDAANNRLGIGSGANSPNGDLDIIKSSINGTSDLSVQNSASSGLSHARIYTQVHSGSTGDPYFLANVLGGVAWAFGADNSDSDAFVISEAGNLGTNNRLHIASGGAVTIPGTLGVTGASTLAALSATTGTFSSNLTQSAGVTSISVTDNTTNAVDIQQGSDNYINVNTTNASENVSIGNATTNPTVSLLGTGTKTIDGTINTDLTASRTVVTDGSGNLSVNTETGTGSHVKATSPTISGPTFSGTITTPLTASLPVFTNGSSQLTTNAVTGTGNVVMSTSPTLVTPVLGVASATSIALGGGEAFTYGDTSFTLTATGMTTSPTGTAYASRVGKIVTINIPYITGTSNATSFTLTGVPSDYRPPTFDQEVAITLYQNNGTQESGGYCTVTTGGSITITRRDGTLWTNSGTKSVNPANITFIAR